METAADNRIKRYILLTIIIIFAIFLFASLIQFVSAFLGAVMLYVLSKSFATWLIKRKRWSKSMTAILVIIISFFVILLPIAVLVSLLYSKISAVLSNPAILTNSIKQVGYVLQQRFHIPVISENTLHSIQSYGTSLLTLVLNGSLGFITTIIMMYFFLYFMMQNMYRMEAGIIFYLPFNKDKIKLFGDELVSQTFSNAVGIPAICIVEGLCAFLCYWIAGMHQSGFWAVITGFCALIPVVGTGLVWVPSAVYLLILGHTWQSIFVIFWGAIVLGSMDNVVRFVLAKKMADVHPIITVLGVIIGLNYFGFLGLIFGPLLISYFIILLRIYYTEYQRPIKARPAKRRQLMPSYMQPFLGNKRSSRKTSNAKEIKKAKVPG